MPNDLRNEKSPYLQSAAHQPVNWLPWSDEAFQRAKTEDKPILVDIGAVWCHWCHVMDSESYENSEVAKIINENFIPMKVDRDERPDIDARLQTAVSAISGQGGWPLTASLTPDGKVFFGGTYFPPDDRHGRPGLKRVLQTLAEKYRTERRKILESAEELYSNLMKTSDISTDSTGLSGSLVDSALSSISNAFDIRNGGFGGLPKFPHASAIEFLLWRFSISGQKWMLTIVDSTLKAMAKGGVYDQLAGGFHRYSTDERWIVPHFEKMLYDNGELLKNYVHAYQATGDEFFKEVAHGIISFVDTVLSDHEHGGFYASQDADIGMDDDGDYFTWTNEEAKSTLTPQEFEVVSTYYHLDAAGDRHTSDRHVLYVARDASEIADSLKKPESEVRSLIRSAKEKLLKARLQRKTPFVDPTVYTNWNGMMISAYLEAYKAFNQKTYLDFALKTLERIINEAVSPTFDVAHSVGNKSESSYLEDHVQVSSALLEAYEITRAEKYLSIAERIMNRTIDRYCDREGGGFSDLPPETATVAALRLPNKPIQDSPSSGSQRGWNSRPNPLKSADGERPLPKHCRSGLKVFCYDLQGLPDLCRDLLSRSRCLPQSTSTCRSHRGQTEPTDNRVARSGAPYISPKFDRAVPRPKSARCLCLHDVCLRPARTRQRNTCEGTQVLWHSLDVKNRKLNKWKRDKPHERNNRPHGKDHDPPDGVLKKRRIST
jgi:uncharacterized protein YyaL (SSP411 family)